ncbi:MAG: tetratricopeptide repeat protein [Steroidobacteraceae bacterium]|nr:tetratricopeptide repeat protein [Steroidobacteraceae bacterium]
MAGDGSRLQRWFAEVRRRKVLRVAGVYLVAAWLAIQVADAVFEPLGLPGWALKLVIILAALGFPLACALAWAFDVTPLGIERTPELPTVATTALPVAEAPAAPAASVAILPFADLSPGHDHEYFCDGIAEEIINALCCVRGLRVASRTSSFQFKGRSADVREIGRSLGVGAVLEGSVRKAGERVRVTAQLVSAGDGYHLWSESYDRQLEDVFAIQSDIAQRLVRALRIALTPQESALLVRGGTRNAEAYDLYLRGQQRLRDYSDGPAAEAAALFQSAIALDPDFAQAHAGLASALAIKGVWRIDMTPADVRAAIAASERALALEPYMPDAHLARAWLMSMQGRGEEAARDFDEAIRLNPTSHNSYYLYGRHCFSAGQMEKAVGLYRKAIELEPDDFQSLAMLVSALQKLGRHDEAGAVNVQTGAAIERRLQRRPDDVRALLLGAVQAAIAGDAQRAITYGERALVARPDDFSTAYNVACAYAVLGDRDRALELLDRAVRGGRGNLGWIENDPDLDNLRGDPRFAAIVGRLRAAAAGAAS